MFLISAYFAPNFGLRNVAYRYTYFLDVIQLLYKQNVCCNKNSAYEKDGVYYLIFDYPTVPKRFKRILHEYGVRCGDNIFAANLRENAQEICRSNAIAVIGKCL